ncbi:MAG TPA: mechanosensitive ion channel domain-containing protein [Azospirillaceae bacterium]|nr:mechanosensitive ion channel domain-containing protein [Azospirillaceae bacterium]
MPALLAVLLRRLLPALACLTLLAVPLAAPLHAQEAGKQPAEAAAPKPEEIEKLVRTLEDPAQRQVLLDQLKTLMDAQRAAAPPQPQETLGVRALTAVTARVEDLSEQVAAAGRALVDTPRALRWLNRQVTEPELRARWARLAFELSVVLAAGYAARLLAMGLLAAPRRRLEARGADTRWLAKLPLLAARTLLDAVPVVAFALAGFGALSTTNPEGAVQLAARTFINASLMVQVVMVVARLLLSPGAPNLRLVRVADETAHYAYIWIRRIAFTAVYGQFIADAAFMLGLPNRPYMAMLKLVGLVVVTMLVVLVLQNRHPVAEWLRGTPLSGPLPPDPDAAAADARHQDAVLAAAIAGTAPPEPPPATEKRTALRAARRRLADVWHVLTILYLVVLYGIWALEVRGGFEFVLWATLTTLVTLVAARLVAVGVDRLIRRGFAIPPELQAQYPGLEQRANRYLPVLHRILKGAVWVVAGLVILDAWGLDSLAWLATPFGQRVSASLVSILLVVGLAFLAWELVSGIIERYLTATDRTTGAKVERSARVRTLLPLLRNAFMVLLVALVTLTTLSELGLDIAPLLAGAGVIGLAIGFGAQTLVKDVITGLFILFEDTIAVGDVVTVGGQGGVVESISIRTMRLRDFSGTVHTIPFSNVTNVSNSTKDFSFAVFDVSVAYREDPDRVIAVLGELGAELRTDPVFGREILEPIEIVGVDAFLDSAVVVKARIKTRPSKRWMIQREFNKRMKKRFDEVGIEIPFPQRTVHIENLPENPDTRAVAVQAAAKAAD